MNLGDENLRWLMLLVKLDVLGIRKVSYSYGAAMFPGFTPPPCSIELAVVSLSRDFLQFVPKSKYPREDWFEGV